MAKERVINTKFWDDQYIVTLDPIEKLLFLYLLTNPLTNIAGIYEITTKRIAFDTGIDRDTVLRILNRFEEAGRVYYRDGYIIIKNFIKHQAVSEKSKIKAGIEKILNELPDNIKIALEGISIPYEGISIPYSNTNSNSNTNENSKGLIDYYFKKFEEKFKVKPSISGGKDGALLKKLHETYGFEKVKQLIDLFFDSKDRFIVDSGYTIGVFFSQINKLLIELSKNDVEKIPETTDEQIEFLRVGVNGI